MDQSGHTGELTLCHAGCAAPAGSYVGVRIRPQLEPFCVFVLCLYMLCFCSGGALICAACLWTVGMTIRCGSARRTLCSTPTSARCARPGRAAAGPHLRLQVAAVLGVVLGQEEEEEEVMCRAVTLTVYRQEICVGALNLHRLNRERTSDFSYLFCICLL